MKLTGLVGEMGSPTGQDRERICGGTFQHPGAIYTRLCITEHRGKVGMSPAREQGA